MSAAEYLLALARIAAFADNAHDVFGGGDDSWWPDTRLPVKLVWFPDGLLIARTAPEQAALLGARITRIEELAPDELLERLHAVCGGTEPYRRWNALWMLSNDGLLHALGVARFPDRLRLELEQPDGRRQRLELAYVPATAMPASLRPTRLLSMELSAAEAARTGGSRRRLAPTAISSMRRSARYARTFAAPLTAAAWLAGRDLALEAVRTDLARH